LVFFENLSKTWVKNWVATLLVKMTDPIDKMAKIYVNEVMRLHGVPVSIVSDRDPRFTSRLWPSIQRALGTNLNINTAFSSAN